MISLPRGRGAISNWSGQPDSLPAGGTERLFCCWGDSSVVSFGLRAAWVLPGSLFSLISSKRVVLSDFQ